MKMETMVALMWLCLIFAVISPTDAVFAGLLDAILQMKKSVVVEQPQMRTIGSAPSMTKAFCMSEMVNPLLPQYLRSVRCDRIDIASTDRIIGGFKVEPHSLPYHVALFSNALPRFCGGSIVSPMFVITAAHCCVHFGTGKEIIVHAGRNDISKENETYAQIQRVDRMILHENFYMPHTFADDICLLRLAKPLDLDSDKSKVKAIALPPPGTYFEPNSTGRVAGWGLWNFTSVVKYPDILQAVDVPIVDWAKCKESYDKLTPTMLCAGAEGIDSCQGDSGGGLVCDGLLCGIVSWGRSCALRNFPGVYTNVAAYMPWIEARMRDYA